MRRLLLLATAGTLAALVAIAPAGAKGPASASLTGPGIDHAIPVKGEAGTDTPLGALVQLGGFFPQMFVEAPDPTTQTRPTGDLGPRYRVTYRVPGPNGPSTVAQDVYPYAKPPLTYMSSGLRFWGTNHAHGGWFVAAPGLKAALVTAGLPASPPVSGGGSSFPWAWTVGGVFAVVLLLLLVLRRRGVTRLPALRSTA
jgi:hypothetical protein